MFFGGTLATVSSSSKNPAAAQALLEFLSSPGPALAANQQRGNVPALTELLDSDYVQSNRFVQFAMENLDVAKREGGPAKWLEVRGDVAPPCRRPSCSRRRREKSLDDLAGVMQVRDRPLVGRIQTQPGERSTRRSPGSPDHVTRP